MGGGRMGEALLTGLLAAGWAKPDELGVVEKLVDRRADLTKQFAGVAILAEPETADGVVVAVKPDDVENACAAIARAGCGRVLSIAAGVPLARLESALGGEVPVVRAMPNTPAAIGQGVTALCANAYVGAAQKQLCEALMAAVGAVHWIDDEDQMHAITAMSGGGPAYVFLLIETLAKAGIACGLPADLAWPLARATVAGSGALAAHSEEPVEVLRQNVTSPGGTTQAALEVLMAKDGIGELLERAIAAATRRSRELA